MATTRRRRVSAAAAALAVGVGGWVIAFSDSDTPSASEAPTSASQIDPLAMPFVISFSRSPSGETVAFGQKVLVNAEAISGEPVELFELWDGGVVVDTAAPASPDSSQVYLEWNALVPGSHLLFVRGVDALGAVALSASRTVTVGVTPGAAQGEPAYVETVAGTPAGAVASGLGVPPDQVVVGEDADGPVTAADDPAAPVGDWVSVVLDPAAILIVADPAALPFPKVTLPDTTVPTTEPTSPPTSSIPIDTTTTTTATTVVTSTPTSAHTITVDVTDCKATLTITPPFTEQASLGVATNGTGFFQNRPGGINAGAEKYVDGPLMPGTYVWVTQIDSGPDPSPVSATVPAECAELSGWSGDTSIINGVLSLPAAMKGVYIYIGPAGGNESFFQRIPAAENEFINTSLPNIDIGPLLPSFSNWSTVLMEVWIGDGNVAALVAQAVWHQPDGLDFQEVVGAPQVLDLYLELPNGIARSKQLTAAEMNDTSEVLQLEWTSPASDVILWQVTNHPLARHNTTLQPTGLLANGVSYGPHASFFHLDAGSIPHEHITSEFEATGGGDVPVVSPDTSLDPNAPAQFGVPGTEFDMETSSAAEIDQIFEALTAPAGREVFVRALAIENNQVIGVASPIVRVIYPYEEPPAPLQVDFIDFDPGNIPNPNWARCALVEVPWDEPGWVAPTDVSPEQLASLMKYYDEDSDGFSYCYVAPTQEDLSVWEEAGLLLTSEWEMAKDGWDAVATFYNKFLDDASSFIAAWNPVCEWVSGASADADATCKQITKAIAKIAIAAVMTYLGLPPSLPTSSVVADAFTSALEGDLSGIAEQWMIQLGVPCDELTMSNEDYDKLRGLAGKAGVEAPDNTGDSASLCREVARILMRKAVKEAKQLISQQSAAVIGGPAPPVAIEGFSIVPDPDGIWQPMTAVVTATRNPAADVPDSFTCQLTADLSSELDSNFHTFYAGTTATMRLDTSGGYPAGTWVASFVFTERTSLELTPALALEIDSFGASMTLEPGACGNKVIYESKDFGPPAPDPA